MPRSEIVKAGRSWSWVLRSERGSSGRKGGLGGGEARGARRKRGQALDLPGTVRVQNCGQKGAVGERKTELPQLGLVVF